MTIPRKSNRESAFRKITDAVRQLAEVQDRARALGVFPNDRPLLNCPKCDLEEDVAASGLLLVTKRGARHADTGLRFQVDLQASRARCPGCAADFAWDDDGPVVDPKRSLAPAMRSFLGITDSWGLSEKQERMLLAADSSEYRGWKTGRTALPRSTMRRIHHLQVISSSLHILLNGQAADTWIKKSNATPLFKGRSALEQMLSGRVDDVLAVRRYLEGQLKLRR